MPRKHIGLQSYPYREIDGHVLGLRLLLAAGYYANSVFCLVCSFNFESRVPKNLGATFVICFAVGRALLGSKECSADNIERFAKTIKSARLKSTLVAANCRIYNATVNSCLRRN